MISPDWVRMMARYNSCQNNGLRREVENLDEVEARCDRGAFFRSILGPANHLLWADAIWLSRFSEYPKPPGGIAQSVALTPDVADWSAMRVEVDRAIVGWAERVTDLSGDLGWVAASTGQAMRQPLALLVTHFFNHQTHHRGQIHAMLTAAGADTGVTDLPYMPDDA